jgi:hypothetical protein
LNLVVAEPVGMRQALVSEEGQPLVSAKETRPSEHAVALREEADAVIDRSANVLGVFTSNAMGSEDDEAQPRKDPAIRSAVVTLGHASHVDGVSIGGEVVNALTGYHSTIGRLESAHMLADALRVRMQPVVQQPGTTRTAKAQPAHLTHQPVFVGF